MPAPPLRVGLPPARGPQAQAPHWAGLGRDAAEVPRAPAPVPAPDRLPAVIRRSRRRVSAARLRAVAEDLLEASTLCAISTVSASGRAHVNTAYFAWGPDLRIVWLSEPRAQHSRNLRANPSAAVA